MPFFSLHTIVGLTTMATTLTFGLNSFILNLDAHFFWVFIYIYIGAVGTPQRMKNVLFWC